MSDCNLLSMFSAVKRALLVVNNHHGSGIDCDWTMEIRTQKSGKRIIVLHNSWHLMDDNGFYDGYYDFELRIPAHDYSKWRIVWGKGTNYYKINHKHAITDYLSDTFSNTIDSYHDTLMNWTNKIQIKCWYFKGILN